MVLKDGITMTRSDHSIETFDVIQQLDQVIIVYVKLRGCYVRVFIDKSSNAAKAPRFWKLKI